MERRRISLTDLLHNGPQGAMRIGTAVHSLLERIADAALPDAARCAEQWRKETSFDEDTKRQACALVLLALQKEEVRAALGRPSPDSEIWVEKPFEAIIDGQWVSGVFDRVTLKRSGSDGFAEAAVLDYKTDSAETETDIGELVETYRPQMRLYIKVVQSLTGLRPDKVIGRLLFVRPGRVVTVKGG
jgi:ATP-dependent exoDNAse (exonuclease V) beta subunit